MTKRRMTSKIVHKKAMSIVLKVLNLIMMKSFTWWKTWKMILNLLIEVRQPVDYKHFMLHVDKISLLPIHFFSFYFFAFDSDFLKLATQVEPYQFLLFHSFCFQMKITFLFEITFILYGHVIAKQVVQKNRRQR